MRTSPLPWARPCLLPISTTSPGCLMFLWSAGIVNPILAPGLLSFYSTILTWGQNVGVMLTGSWFIIECKYLPALTLGDLTPTTLSTLMLGFLLLSSEISVPVIMGK